MVFSKLLNYGASSKSLPFIDSGDDTYADPLAWKQAVEGLYFPTEAEATFRLLLYQNPAEALTAFLKATGGEYKGTCLGCEGTGRQAEGTHGNEGRWIWKPVECKSCHGTGGPPSRDLLQVFRDWCGERGMTMEEEVLTGIINAALGESK
jgi:hypothetical protein